MTLRRLRALLSPLLAAVLLLGGTLVAAGPAAAGERHRPAVPRLVDVMAFNIHHAAGTDGVVDLERIASVIRRSGADVVGLQEVDRHFGERSDWRDQATELAELLDYDVVFGANLDRDPPAAGAPRAQYGTAILSRHQIVSSSNTLLHRSPDQEQRGLLSAEVDVRGTRLTVLNTHLAASSQPDRAAQARQVAERVDTGTPTVLVGDLNAEPGAPELAPLARVLDDAWERAGHRGMGDTFPALAPTQRIDYVLTSRLVRPLTTRVVNRTPEASDHLPVLSKVLVRPAR